MSHHSDSSDAGMMPQGPVSLVKLPDLLELVFLLVLDLSVSILSLCDGRLPVSTQSSGLSYVALFCDSRVIV